MEFANVSVRGWIIEPDVHGLLDGPSGGVCLPAHNGEIVHTDVMPKCVIMVIDGERGPETFFQPFPEGPCRLPYVFLLIIHLVTLRPLDYPTSLSDIIAVLGGHQEVLDSVASFEMDLDFHPSGITLKTFAMPFGVWDHHVNVPVVTAAAVAAGGLLRWF